MSNFDNNFITYGLNKQSAFREHVFYTTKRYTYSKFMANSKKLHLM